MRTIKFIKKYAWVGILGIFLSAILNNSYGQGILPGQGDDKDWNFVIAPYAWFSALNGQIIVGTVEADMDADFSDIFSNLNMGFMLYGEARYKKFGIIVDWLTVSMTLDGTRPITGESVKVNQDMMFLETSFLYSAFHNDKWSADVKLGLRTWWMDTGLEVDRIIGEEPLRAEGSVSWVDPLFGARAVFLPHRSQ